MSSKSSKAVVVLEPQRMEIREFPVSRLPEGWILVKVKATGVCGTDLHIWHGRFKPAKYPLILGHENIGVVEEMGEGVKVDGAGRSLGLGDHIIWPPGVPCNNCYFCNILRDTSLCPNRQGYGLTLTCDTSPYLNGGFAEYIMVRPGTSVFKLPKELPLDAFVMAGCAGASMFHGVEKIGVEFSETVVVQGVGAVGLFGVALASLRGAGRIIALDFKDARLKFAQRLGADCVIDLKQHVRPEDRVEEVKRLTGGIGADVVMECTGIPSAILEGLQMLRKGGRYLTIGQTTSSATVPIDPFMVNNRSITIYGCWGSTGTHLYHVLHLIEEGRLKLAEAVTHKFPLSQAVNALETAEKNPEAIKVVIEP